MDIWIDGAEGVAQGEIAATRWDSASPGPAYSLSGIPAKRKNVAYRDADEDGSDEKKPYVKKARSVLEERDWWATARDTNSPPMAGAHATRAPKHNKPSFLGIPLELRLPIYQRFQQPRILTTNVVGRNFTSADGRQGLVADTLCTCSPAIVVQNAPMPQLSSICKQIKAEYERGINARIQDRTILHVLVRDNIPANITGVAWNVKTSGRRRLADANVPIATLAWKFFAYIASLTEEERRWYDSGNKELQEYVREIGDDSADKDYLVELCVKTAEDIFNGYPWTREVNLPERGWHLINLAWEHYICTPISAQRIQRDQYYHSRPTEDEQSDINRGYDPFVQICLNRAMYETPIPQTSLPRTKEAILHMLDTWNVETHCLNKIKHCNVRLSGTAILECIVEGGFPYDLWEQGYKWLNDHTIEQLQTGQRDMPWTPTKDKLCEVSTFITDLRTKMSPEASIHLTIDLTGWELSEWQGCDHMDWVTKLGIQEKYRYWFCLHTFMSHIMESFKDVTVSFYKTVASRVSRGPMDREECSEYRKSSVESLQWISKDNLCLKFEFAHDQTVMTMNAKRDHDRWVEGAWLYQGTVECICESTPIPGISQA